MRTWVWFDRKVQWAGSRSVRAFVCCPFERVRLLLEALAARGIEGGLDISGRMPGAEHALLVCATECRTDDDIERYATELAALLAGEGA